MQRTAKLLISFLLFLLIIPPGYASDGTTTIRITGTYTASGTIQLFSVNYSFAVTGGTIILGPNNVQELQLGGTFKIWGFPQSKDVKLSDVTLTTLEFKDIILTVTVNGPTHGSVTYQYSHSQGSISWSNNHGTYSLDRPEILSGPWDDYQDIHCGLHYWSVTVSLVYHSTHDDTDVKYTFKAFNPFADFYILRYRETGDWTGDIASGVNIAFSTLVSIWQNLGSKINNLDFGSILHLDVLGFLGAIETVLVLFGYAIFQTFTVPLTALSLIMAHTANPLTVSFFLIALVVAVLLAITLFVVLWKIIILVKP